MVVGQGKDASTGQSENFLSVVIRIRPLMPRELQAGAQDIINVIQRQDSDEQLVQVRDVVEQSGDAQMFSKRVARDDKQFSFLPVFDRYADHGNIFNTSVKPLITKVLQGYSATVFAYGHTGSGKTHTMLGTERDAGVALLSLSSLFETLEEHPSINARVTMSFAEVFEENVYDLMGGAVDQNATSGPEVPEQRREMKTLELREDEAGATVVVGLTEHEVRVIDEAYELVYLAQSKRSTEETRWNLASSRSHAIFTVQVYLRETDGSPVSQRRQVSSKKNGGDPSWWTPSLDSWSSDAVGRLRFVDLAGSERYTGDNKRTQTKTINQSLLALSTCLASLGDKQSRNQHVPFRDSKLTRLLKDMLLGRAHSVMISCISPSDQHYDETVNTLTYSMHARNIRINATVGVRSRPVTVEEYDHVIQDLKGQIASLRLALAEAQGMPAGDEAKRSPFESESESDAGAPSASASASALSSSPPRDVGEGGAVQDAAKPTAASPSAASAPHAPAAASSSVASASGSGSSLTPLMPMRTATTVRETQQRLSTLLREQVGLLRHLARLRARHVDIAFDLHYLRIRYEGRASRPESASSTGSGAGAAVADKGTGAGPPVAPAPQPRSFLQRIMKGRSSEDTRAKSPPPTDAPSRGSNPGAIAQLQQQLAEVEAESRGLLDRYEECEMNRRWALQQAEAALQPANNDLRKSSTLSSLLRTADNGSLGGRGSQSVTQLDQQHSPATDPSKSALQSANDMAWQNLLLAADLHRALLHDLKLQVRGQDMQRLLQLQYHALSTHGVVSAGGDPGSDSGSGSGSTLGGYHKMLAMDAHISRCLSCLPGCVPSADGHTAPALSVGLSSAAEPPPLEHPKSSDSEAMLLKPSSGFHSLLGWGLEASSELETTPMALIAASNTEELYLGDSQDSLTSRGRRLTHLEWHPKNVNTPRSSREHQQRLRRMSLYVSATGSGAPAGPRSASATVRQHWQSGDLPTAQALQNASTSAQPPRPLPGAKPPTVPVGTPVASTGSGGSPGSGSQGASGSPPHGPTAAGLSVTGVGQHAPPAGSGSAASPQTQTQTQRAVVTGDRSLPHQHPGGIAVAEGIASESVAAEINKEMKEVRHRLDELLDAKYSMLKQRHAAMKTKPPAGMGQAPDAKSKQLVRTRPLHRRSVSEDLAASDGPLASLLGKMADGKEKEKEKGKDERRKVLQRGLSPIVHPPQRRRSSSSTGFSFERVSRRVPDLRVSSVEKAGRDQSLPPVRPRNTRLRINKSENTLARRLEASPLRGKPRGGGKGESGRRGASPVPRLRLDGLSSTESAQSAMAPSLSSESSAKSQSLHTRAVSEDASPLRHPVIVKYRKGGRRRSSSGL